MEIASAPFLIVLPGVSLAGEDIQFVHSDEQFGYGYAPEVRRAPCTRFLCRTASAVASKAA
jgi:hypothetical protein